MTAIAFHCMDPFDQDDYAKMTAEIGEQVQIVGDDDLLVTNPKVNQSGSVTESIEVVRMSKRAGLFRNVMNIKRHDKPFKTVASEDRRGIEA
ncbi:hypothetical protein L6452_12492 [Arctium lappa]|uniref:Uncharacterized protein n=1 Tax=Arctium lappa TaxID=4217 RepID=A0ACB9DRA5_ARCLA|nr:hypothetical protein L6452_12492 [Arctium lappa]